MIENRIIISQKYQNRKNPNDTVILEEVYGDKLLTSHGMISRRDFSVKYSLIKKGKKCSKSQP